jgi:biopolymer transport protein ExbD
MAFETKTGNGGSSIADINMTPMIDVLLVLLVIFMLLQPLMFKSLDVQLPLEEKRQATAEVPPIVLEIDGPGDYRINSEPVPTGRLEERLREIYVDRPDKVLFIKADGRVVYSEVISAMDAARGAGVSVLGAVLGEQPRER